MDIKAVFFDLDGTLFTSTRGIAASTRRAIIELHQQGILVGIASGRGPAFCLPLMEELNFDFAVTYNGQYVFTPKEVLIENPLDKKLLRKIARFAIKNNRDISLGTSYGANGSSLMKFGESRFGGWLAGILPSNTSGLARGLFKNIIRRLLPRGNYVKLLRDPIYQVMMVATREEQETLEAEFPEILITRSNSYAIDMIPQNSGKLQAIQQVGLKYGFDLPQVMVFGDSENDLPMIAGVGLGVAMGNAQAIVKEKAAYVTDTNNQDGIAKALAHHGLINFTNTQNFVSKDPNFNKVKEFHKLMDGKTQEIPKPFSVEEAGNRAGFKVEELVEFLYAAADGEAVKFDGLIREMHKDVDKAVQKILDKRPKNTDNLTAQVDAMMDLLYFTYGSLVLAGVDPYDIFEVVHRANMAKIFPDGKAHFDAETHKILKPSDWEKKYAPEAKIARELERQRRVALRKVDKK